MSPKAPATAVNPAVTLVTGGSRGIGRAVVDLLAFPARALPSLIELRPSRPPKR